MLLSVVNQTILSGESGEVLARKTAGRIMALSRAHDLLSFAEWSPVALSQLVVRTAEHEQIIIKHDGPDIMLRPEAVAPMAQALHELAVNHRLHGGPSAGGVVVKTEASGERFRIEWVTAKSATVVPIRSGFGLRLVRLCLERQLFGTIERLDTGGMAVDLPLRFLAGDETDSEPFAARFGKR